MTNPRVLLIDLDGTLCDCDDRVRASLNREGKLDYDKFFVPELVFTDKINEWCWSIIKGLQILHANQLLTIILTGRDENLRPVTERWLRLHGVAYNELFMKPNNKAIYASVFKESIIRETILPKYKIFLAIDDDPRNVEMMKGLGITCLQVPRLL